MRRRRVNGLNRFNEPFPLSFSPSTNSNSSLNVKFVKLKKNRVEWMESPKNLTSSLLRFESRSGIWVWDVDIVDNNIDDE